MKILQGGVPKCGNFWLYEIIQKILSNSGANTDSYIEKQPIYPLAKTWDLNFPGQARIDVVDITDLQCSYRISSIFRMPILDLKEYVKQTRHVWTHSPICKRSREVFSLFEKKIYIIRDPRDRALSAAKYYCSDYMLKYFPQGENDPEVFLKKNFDQLMHEWVWHVWDHLRLSQSLDIHIVFYENLLSDFQQELKHLTDYLEVDLDDYQKEVIEKEVSFSNMKKQNPKHLKTGTSGHWKFSLSDEQIDNAEIIAGPLMQFLGYRSGNSNIHFNKKSSPSVYQDLKQELILSQEQRY